MSKAELKTATHTIIKNEDVVKYLIEKEIKLLEILLDKINHGRLKDGKKLNEYYTVNTDEPYAQEVLDLILTKEFEKENNLNKTAHEKLLNLGFELIHNLDFATIYENPKLDTTVIIGYKECGVYHYNSDYNYRFFGLELLEILKQYLEEQHE